LVGLGHRLSKRHPIVQILGTVRGRDGLAEPHAYLPGIAP
jgi:hypothetical protein